MSDVMRAVVVGEDKGLRVSEVPRPRAGKGELLLRVSACGICGSDVHAVDFGMVGPGIVLGHEYAGEVAEIGEGVAGEWQIGDRANGLGALICGQCENCLEGRYGECSSYALIGFQPEAGGAYSEYVRVSAAGAFRIPDGVSDVDAAAVEPLAVGYNAFCDGKVEPGESVLIIGAGPIGAGLAQWARYFGCFPIGISDLIGRRLERAGKLGADVLIDANEDSDPVAAFHAKTGVTPKVIFECTGAPGIVSSLVAAAPHECHLVLAGTGMQQESIRVADAAMKELRMSFSMGYPPEIFPKVLFLLEQGRLSTTNMITDTVTLEEVPEIFDELKRPNEHGKVIIKP
jgi:(R,R)-butanediol dehydrogenase/meso-butanediol dehydrogenase/diacetyl reductase